MALLPTDIFFFFFFFSFCCDLAKKVVCVF